MISSSFFFLLGVMLAVVLVQARIVVRRCHSSQCHDYCGLVNGGSFFYAGLPIYDLFEKEIDVEGGSLLQGTGSCKGTTNSLKIDSRPQTLTSHCWTSESDKLEGATPATFDLSRRPRKPSFFLKRRKKHHFPPPPPSIHWSK